MPYVTATSLHPTFAAKFRTYSRIFSELGAKLETPSGDGYIWRLVHGDRTIVFLPSSFPMNSASAGLLAMDKLATYQILGALGIKIPRGFAFFAPMHDGKPTQMEERFHLANLEHAIRGEFSNELIAAGLIVKPGTDSGGLSLTVSEALSCATPACAAPSVSTVLMLAAAPWRTQGTKVRLALGSVGIVFASR